MASSNPTEPLSEQEPLSRPWFPHGIPKPWWHLNESPPNQFAYLRENNTLASKPMMLDELEKWMPNTDANNPLAAEIRKQYTPPPAPPKPAGA
jgi:hypothetical protein